MVSPFSLDRRTPEEWEAAIEHNRTVCQSTDLSGAVQIYKGRYFWPLEPNHPGNDYEIETPAHALAGINRWNSQTCDTDGSPIHYSVAQHAVHVADICALYRHRLMPEVDWRSLPSPAMLGLRHDDPEAYGFADLTRPVKRGVIGYSENEHRLMNHLIMLYCIPNDPAIQKLVKKVDDMMIFLERDELMGQPVVPYSHEDTHPGFTIHDVVPNFRVWTPAEAKQQYLRRFDAISYTGGNYMPPEYLWFRSPLGNVYR